MYFNKEFPCLEYNRSKIKSCIIIRPTSRKTNLIKSLTKSEKITIIPFTKDKVSLSLFRNQPHSYPLTQKKNRRIHPCYDWKTQSCHSLLRRTLLTKATKQVFLHSSKKLPHYSLHSKRKNWSTFSHYLVNCLKQLCLWFSSFQQHFQP